MSNLDINKSSKNEFKGNLALALKAFADKDSEYYFLNLQTNTLNALAEIGEYLSPFINGLNKEQIKKFLEFPPEKISAFAGFKGNLALALKAFADKDSEYYFLNLQTNTLNALAEIGEYLSPFINGLNKEQIKKFLEFPPEKISAFAGFKGNLALALKAFADKDSEYYFLNLQTNTLNALAEIGEYLSPFINGLNKEQIKKFLEFPPEKISAFARFKGNLALALKAFADKDSEYYFLNLQTNTLNALAEIGEYLSPFINGLNKEQIKKFLEFPPEKISAFAGFKGNLALALKAFADKDSEYYFLNLQTNTLNALAEIGEYLSPFINGLNKEQIKKFLEFPPEKISAFAGFKGNLALALKAFADKDSEYYFLNLQTNTLNALAEIGEYLSPFINGLNKEQIKKFLEFPPEKISAFAGFKGNLALALKAFADKDSEYYFLNLQTNTLNALAEIGEYLSPFINGLNKERIKKFLEFPPEKISAFAGFDKKNSDKEISQPSGEIEIKDSEIKVDLGKNNNRHNDFGK